MGLTERERRWWWVTELPFLAVALAAVVVVPSERALGLAAGIALVAACAVAWSVYIPLPANGWASCVQVVFWPLLFFAPLNLALLMVLVGHTAEELVWFRRHRRPLLRVVITFGNCWFAVGPVLVLALAGSAAFSWGDWPVYAGALGAQIAANTLAGGLRQRLHDGAWPALHDLLWVPAAIDATLTLPALTVVAVASDAPVAAALTIGALLIVARGFTSEHSSRLAEHHQATHDPLTGLANRLLLGDLADAAAAQARREGQRCGLLLVDLDAFKAINDELGHAAGDRVLVETGARLRAAVRAPDTVARLGGDEFAVLLLGPQSPESCARVADKLRRAFVPAFDLPAGSRGVGISVGAALFDGDVSLADALRRADEAMYADKRRLRLLPR